MLWCHSILTKWLPFYKFSLGCKCIFLLGGKTRDEVPTAMFLRSGDIVLMAGEARECFHGNAFYWTKVVFSGNANSNTIFIMFLFLSFPSSYRRCSTNLHRKWSGRNLCAGSAAICWRWLFYLKLHSKFKDKYQHQTSLLISQFFCYS